MRSGWWIKQLSGDAEYQAFIPNKLPYEGSIQFDDSILDLLSNGKNNRTVTLERKKRDRPIHKIEHIEAGG